MFFIFTPKIGEDESILTIIFFKGVDKIHVIMVYLGKRPLWYVPVLGCSWSTIDAI